MRRIYAYILIVLAGLALGTACSSVDEEQEKDFVALKILSSDVNSRQGNKFITVQSNTDWTMQISYGNEASGWASLTPTEGNGTLDAVFRWQNNESENPRSLVITVKAGTASDSMIIRQAGKTQIVKPGHDNNLDSRIVQDPYCPDWMELPAIYDNDGLAFFTHRQTFNKRDFRDWSFYWDNKNKVSHWVAYPLNGSLIGSGSRTDAWGNWDEHLPHEFQPDLSKPYRGSYDRGHQIPSADRLNNSSNVRTFLSTNMTPQKGNLNQKVWGKLEGYLRNWAKYDFDTLYVVTGCTVGNSTRTASDHNGMKVTVPGGYFKALLGYRESIKGNEYGGYSGIAFYFDHSDYYNGLGNQDIYKGHEMTIRQLEAKIKEVSGETIDFFVNLPSRIGVDKYNKVETYRDPKGWK